MATISQIRGMLLEEAVLYLLRVSGFETIEQQGSDPTVERGPAGLVVKGRGGQHQIDAIADYVVVQPFSYPQRLLVEAKCHTSNPNVGIEVVRNAVGVLKDVGEYWTSSDRLPLQTRYHYLYALFSAYGFTSPAEQYAFAQDIYLMPLAASPFMQPVVGAITHLKHTHFGATAWNSVEIDMTAFRETVRDCLEDESSHPLDLAVADEARSMLQEFCGRCRVINGALLGMIAKRFPIFLVPAPSINLRNLRPVYQVRIYWDKEGWYLQSRRDDSFLFSFDLPRDLFNLYADADGTLSPGRALDLKAEYLREIQATAVVNRRIRVVRFQLDQEWLHDVRQGFEERTRVEGQG